MIIEKVLTGKLILLFSQYFFGYEKKIEKKMRQYGAEISLFDEMSIKTSYERALLKVSPKIFNKKTEIYYRGIFKKEREKSYDYILFIDCEMPTEEVLVECRQTFPKAKICLYMWDSVKNLQGIESKFKYFDYISSFDREDAKKYKISFRPLFYSDEYRVQDGIEEYKYNWSFVGTIHSDRYAIIRKLIQKSNSCFVYPYLQGKFIYYYYRMAKKEFRDTRIADFKFEKLSSGEITNVVRKSKAVLDMQHPKQTGLTIRTLEMLGMKKKFITTNSDIQNYDFYNKNNICIIDRRNPVVPSEFYNTRYEEVSEKIYEYYSLDKWVLDVLGV